MLVAGLCAVERLLSTASDVAAWKHTPNDSAGEQRRQRQLQSEERTDSDASVRTGGQSQRGRDTRKTWRRDRSAD